MTSGARIRSYKDLEVWQRAVALAEVCYKATATFPASELYGMTSQIRRASVSIAANIAEGYGRENAGSFVQFLRVAQGSARELETHFIIARRVGLLGTSDQALLLDHCEEISKMLRALIRSLEQRK